jgi:transcription elongation factor Elf1
MLHIDTKYASMLQTRLRNFAKKNDYLWNYSCPVCGDSKSNPRKARGYIYKFKQDLLVKCHKCGYSTNIGNLIKFVDSNMYDQYVVERYKSGATRYNDHKEIEQYIAEVSPVDITNICLEDSVLEDLDRIDELPETHPAVKYVAKRLIPKDKWNLLYFCSKFKHYTNSVAFKFTKEEDDHPRLIIPYFNSFGKVVAYQGRAFGNEEPKYYTIKIDETEEKIYGLDRLDYSKRIYVVEGPLDSMFITNAVAVSGSSFDTPTIRSILTNATIVIDNEPRSPEIVKQLAKYIDKGYNVCMYPDTVKEKDINEMILSGKTPDQILDLINTNTFNGIEAKLRFSTWKKC